MNIEPARDRSDAPPEPRRGRPRPTRKAVPARPREAPPASSEPSAAAGAPGAERHEYVLIGRTTGRLRHLGGPGRPPDELDELIDEMFGETTTERPGLFDVGLVAVGLAITAWAWLTNAGGFWLAVGLFALVLGLVLPARDLVQLASRRREARAERRATAKGYLLDVSAPESLDLAEAYEQLLDTVGGGDHRLAIRANEASYRALIEVATLLHGEPPTAEAEREYIRKRTAAIRSAALELGRASRAWSRAADARGPSPAERERRAEAVARAREELEASDRSGSVSQLETVSELLRREADDAGG